MPVGVGTAVTSDWACSSTHDAAESIDVPKLFAVEISCGRIVLLTAGSFAAASESKPCCQSHLVEERLKGMVIATVNDGDIDRQLRQ